jgi:F-type H+-transporting ATPase subunit gamma
MTERLAEITARIEGIAQLGQVVNAMRGIAAARAQQANAQLPAADAHAATIAEAIGDVLALMPPQSETQRASPRTALVVFCAEQGFVGGFGEAVLRAVEGELAAPLFVVGTRGLASLAERGAAPLWSSAMPAHTLGIPRLADRIAEAVYSRVAEGEIAALDAVFGLRLPGQPAQVRRRRLFPLDPADFGSPTSLSSRGAQRRGDPGIASPDLRPPGSPRFARDDGKKPLLTLKPDILLRELTAEYLHAQLCAIALHAFAAENDARMEAMAQAHGQIERQLGELRAVQRRVRQDEITAEIVELAAGADAAL